MGIIDTFENFAAAFEAAVADDNWSRLAPYLAEDVTYLNVGGPDPRVEGRQAVIAFLKADVTNTDRRFDTRTLIALSRPAVQGNHLSRQWRCSYTLAGTPDLVLDGEARYLFEGDLIKAIEEEPTADAMRKLEAWMQTYGNRLQG